MNFDPSVIIEHWRFLSYGIGVTIALAAASGAASLALGFVVALARLFGPRWLRPAVVLYIDSMRAVPVLVVLIWTFFALPDSHRSHDVALRRGADRTHRPSRRVCRGDLPCRHRIGAAWPDPRFVGARHVALADPTAHRAAAGARAHAASVRLAAVDHDQGHRDRLSDRRT